MPDRLAITEAANRHAVLLHIRDHHDLRQSVHRLQTVLLGRHIELAEEAAEGHHFRVTDLLVTEQQHKVVYQGLADSAVGDVIHIRQVHALDLGADRAVDRHDFQCANHRRLRGFCIHRNIPRFR